MGGTRPWPLVGRAEELELIAAALGPEHAPGAGVVLAGAPGVGKTRLAREALAGAGSDRTIRWAAATRSSQQLPLGAVAQLIGEVADDAAPLTTQAAAALLTPTARGAALIGIDDAHLLDEASAAVLQHILLSGAAPVVLTLRSGEAGPDAVTALWKDGYLQRIDLQPLCELQTTELLETVLDGPLDSLSAHRLWELSSGVVLFLQHLVDQERRADRLCAINGIWHWEGDRHHLSPKLAMVVEAQMGVLPGSVGRVVDLLAITEPLATEVLVSLAGRRAVEQAETRGLIVVESTSSGALAARLAHPLYGEVRMVRAEPMHARRLRGQVATALALSAPPGGGMPGSRAERTLRRALLTIDSDLPPDPQLFTAGAQIALLMSDLGTCERLARAALTAGGGDFAARLARGYALALLGRGDDAEHELSAAEDAAADDAKRGAAATIRAANLLWGLVRPAEADQVLDRAEFAIRDEDARAAVTAMRAVMCAGRGRPEAAVACAQRVLERPSLPSSVIAVASFGLVGGLGSLGQADQIPPAAERGYAATVGAIDEPFLRMGLCHFHITGLAAAGYLHEVKRIVEEQHARTRWAVGPARLFGLTLVGCQAVTRGELPTAIRLLNEARTGLGASGALGFDYFCLLWLTRAHAMADEADIARQRLAELEAARHPAFSYLDPYAILDDAWVYAAEGARSTAIGRAHEAAALAAARHQWALEVLVLQMAVRFGDTNCAKRLRELADIVDGPRAPAAAAHAEALAVGDGPGLDAVSAACESMGDLTAAADAAAQAAVAYSRRRLRGAALAAAARARRLAAHCGARTPALAAIGTIYSRLTTRQREIAALVGQGLSNQQIADRLAMSVRTVEGHIYQASRTIGVTSREQLAAVVHAS